MDKEQANMPNPKEIEKEIADFLSKKYGDQVKVVSPIIMPCSQSAEKEKEGSRKEGTITFNLKPEELVAYLDQYVIRQDEAKRILATKICTHFNRIRHNQETGSGQDDFQGRIKNNIIMIGPTGVGKTYLIKLIAQKIGVPFVKGDATKFSETGYVGGDVEDLVRDLVRESDNDMEIAQYGIIYIDEIDKIASSPGHYGADVSRTGVQRALLKPMEETEVEMKVPHDPISMLQEVEQFRKTGKREKRTINTRNILFIVSGAFSQLPDIIKKRTAAKKIGFGSDISTTDDESKLLVHTRAEDLVEFGFESEFIGRLPVRSVFRKLTETDLYDILANPNNPIILSKRFDFATYDIDARFSDAALRILAKRAAGENTGARGLVSVIEEALITFETHLPSTTIRKFPITAEVVEAPETILGRWLEGKEPGIRDADFKRISEESRAGLVEYLRKNRKKLTEQYGLPLSPYRMERIAHQYYAKVVEIGSAIEAVRSFYEQVKRIETIFLNRHDLNIILEEDAIDFISEQMEKHSLNIDRIYHKLSDDFEYGLKLLREKAGINRFFLSRDAVENPEAFLNQLITTELQKHGAGQAGFDNNSELSDLLSCLDARPES